jgi:two-component system chemotaxis response regulator CheY
MTKRLLIVDDSADERRALSAIAAGSGRYSVIGEAGTAAEAFALYRREKPDLVLLDIVMPGVDGIQVARQILGVDPKARIVMVSSDGQEALVMESLVAGASEFVSRPIETKRILHALDKVAGIG